jgi:hypothetical protein
MKLIAVIIICLFTIPDSAKTIPLTDEEFKQVESAYRQKQILDASYNQAIENAHTADLKCEASIAAIGNLQTAHARKLAIEARIAALLAQHRLAHNCPDCERTDDGKALVKPKKD